MSKFCGYHQLNLSREYGEVVKQGRKTVTPCLVLVSKEREEAFTEGARFGLIVSKKVGNAVVRNGVKRRLRAIFREAYQLRQTGHTLPAERDFVFIARAKAAATSYNELREGVLRALWGKAFDRLSEPAPRKAVNE